jgi:hypothetical protein
MKLEHRSVLFAAFLVLVCSASMRASCEFGIDTCKQGFVWRDAFPGDHVCVLPATRDQAAIDNGLAASRRSPNGGPFGPDTCKMGFVWREASPTDHVCVPGATRSQAAADNAQASARRDPICADASAPGFLEVRLRFFRVTDGFQVGDTVVPPAGITIPNVAADRRFVILATAGDSQSGVAGIRASVGESLTCSPPLGGTATNQQPGFLAQSDEEKNGTSPAGTPQLRTATFSLDPFEGKNPRRLCSVNLDQSALPVTTIVTARNGVGLETAYGPIVVTYAPLSGPRTAKGEMCGNKMTGQTSVCTPGTVCGFRRSKVCDGWWIFSHCDYIQTTDMFCD